MRKLMIGFALATILAFTGTAMADVYVQGYYRNDGTYVQPHYRSSPDNSRNNNWSVYPNVNPYTGQRGTLRPSYIQPAPAPLYIQPSPSLSPNRNRSSYR